MKRSVLLLGILYYLLSSSAIAQDFIKETYIKMDSSSIIRTINPQKWLIYSIYYHGSSFVMVTETGTVAPVMHFPVMQDGYCIVNDFEILGDSVFFCGQKNAQMI